MWGFFWHQLIIYLRQAGILMSHWETLTINTRSGLQWGPICYLSSSHNSKTQWALQPAENCFSVVFCYRKGQFHQTFVDPLHQIDTKVLETASIQSQGKAPHATSRCLELLYWSWLCRYYGESKAWSVELKFSLCLILLSSFDWAVKFVFHTSDIDFGLKIGF